MPEVAPLPINIPVGKFPQLSDAEAASADRFGGNAGVPHLGQRLNEANQVGFFHSQLWTDPALASTTGIHAAVTDTAVPVTVTTAITQPDMPRNITATAGGTAGDIKAVSVIITGTDIDGTVITETLPAFTVDTAGSVTGSKAFKTVTSIYIPAHDGTGATTAIGYGAKLGLDRILQRGNTVVLATADGVYETTRPTVAFSTTELASNTISFNTAFNGSRNFEAFWIDCNPY